MNLLGKIKKIAYSDKRYPPEAYFFVMDALRYTVHNQNKHGHVTAKQLLEGLREYALEEFGLLTRVVLQTWGITSTGDIGEIVFNLVENQVWSATEEDKKEDFHDVYQFDEAFGKDYDFFS